jgi:hypothetical protein
MNNSIYQRKSKEPESMLKATKCLIQTLYTKYEKADLRAIVKDNCNEHFSTPDKHCYWSSYKNLRSCLMRHLRDWYCEPASLNLNEGSMPHHGRHFPIPQNHLETAKEEIHRLCDFGVIKWQADSKRTSPTFIVPKKDNTVCVVSNFREVNKRIVRKPFPIPQISTVLQDLKGFTYATALDLNRGYYN